MKLTVRSIKVKEDASKYQQDVEVSIILQPESIADKMLMESPVPLERVLSKGFERDSDTKVCLLYAFGILMENPQDDELLMALRAAYENNILFHLGNNSLVRQTVLNYLKKEV